jgi:ATP-dependent Zn protease
VKAAQHEAIVGMGPGGVTMTKQTRFNVGYAIAAIFLVFIIQYAVSVANQIAPIPYSDFQRLLHEGKIATVGVSDRFIQGSLKEPLPGGQKQFVTTRVDPEFAGELDKYGVRYTGQIESTFLRDLLSWVMPVLLFVGLWWYLGKRFAEWRRKTWDSFTVTPNRRRASRCVTVHPDQCQFSIVPASDDQTRCSDVD